MIKKIHIENFQCHKDTTIHLHQGLNIFVGLSNHGKTAIVRAIRWVTENRPSGNSFRSNWGGKTKVLLRTNDGVVIRAKGKSSYYKVGNLVLQAMGQQVPEEVSRLLKWSDVNIQHQMDSHFLLSRSAGEVSRFFNSVINLEVIDRSMSNINSMISELRKSLQESKEERVELRRELFHYDRLPDLQNRVETLKRIALRVSGVEKEITLLESSVKDLEEIEGVIEKLSECTGLLSSAEPILSLIKKIDSVVSAIENLEARISEILQTKNSIQEMESRLVDMERTIPQRCPTCKQPISKENDHDTCADV